jgi:allophanate hydrolase
MDFMLLPTAGAAYTHEEVAAEPVSLNTNLGYYTNFVNLLDLAALAIPAGMRSNGIPFGVTLIGPAWSDAALLTTTKDLEAPYCPAGYVPLAVCGAHLTGQPLNFQLTTAGAFLIEACQTSPDYRLYALSGTVPPKPGLVYCPEGGMPIDVEVWAVPENTFGPFVAAIPSPLAIGTCTLYSGRKVKSFVCEPWALKEATEITQLGGWKQYLSRKV